MKKEIKVGIGFATGRKSFQKVLQTNVYNWRECGLTEQEKISLNLYVAYDLKYSDTKKSDYTNIREGVRELIDGACFIGSSLIRKEQHHLIEQGVLTHKEATLFFTGGYAAKRNAILYFAMKDKIDYLIYLDDDEYPIAVTNSQTTALWSGQHILRTHLKHIDKANITNGHHCGYISPIPYIAFNHVLTEDDFRLFIEAISNDIINWEKVRATMQRGGVTYADKDVLISNAVEEVQEINGAKFISGSNLCINLNRSDKVYPFYNPPRARGEDTFLSTCLSDSKVLRVPCYSFHDAFAFYKPLMDGVLPIWLKKIKIDSPAVINRFYKACIGWIRYKPLLMYITNPEQYEAQIEVMRQNLAATLPKICKYFKNDDFMEVGNELEYYHRNVRRHYKEFVKTQEIWVKIREHLLQGEKS